ncbi:hypothetical protein V8J82_09900 [Gymnodinialimonas sp. 2305UL16-5]|uniref:hypothetical protein n=1 Tax=Gymnodinialimonas mytili TaxID=3126503 RepID=UPI0030B1C2F4
MSTLTQSSGEGRQTEFIVIGLIVAVVIGVGAYIYSQSQTELRASPMGFDGLETWLDSRDVPAQNFFGGWQIERNRVDLAIVPLFDTDLAAQRARPSTQEELLLQQDEFDQFMHELLAKTEAVPTLIVLPKWRTGLRLTGIGHPILLSEHDRIERAFQSIVGLRGAELTYAPTAFSNFSYIAESGDPMEAQIYAAQVISGADCRPIIGTQEAMLLGACASSDGKTEVLVLSDPDLLNNHGLRLGDNATIAADFLGTLYDGGLMLIDYSTQSWFIEAREAVTRERDWDDLLRFFAPPFTFLWMGGAACMALAIWRSGIRNGPPRRSQQDLGASKTLAIRARARLMRLTDQDGAMLGAYASARIAATATAILGPAHGPSYGTDATFQTYVQRRHPAHAARLASVLDNLRGAPNRITASEAASHVRNLEEVLEDITHDT